MTETTDSPNTAKDADIVPDVETTEVTQPNSTSAPSGYPYNRINDTTERLLDLGGELVGYKESDMHYNPIIRYSGETIREVCPKIIDLFDQKELTGPGVTVYLLDDCDQLWGLVFVEDWYEECIPYQKLHLSRGDPTCLGYIHACTQDERDRLTEYGLMPVRDYHADNEIALWGQVQMFHVRPMEAVHYLDRVEKGNPDYDPELDGRR